MDAPSDAVVEPLTATVRYRDSRGFVQEIRVTSTMAREIRNVRQQARRADRRWEARHALLGEGDLDLATQDRPRLPASDGSPWEGPKVGVTLLLGLRLQWPPPPPDRGPCPGCGSRPLPVLAACLVCHSTGIPIPRPTAAELRLKRCRQPRRDGLAGGVGSPTAPKAKVKPAPPPPAPAPRAKAKPKKVAKPKPKATWMAEYQAWRGAARGEG